MPENTTAETEADRARAVAAEIWGVIADDGLLGEARAIVADTPAEVLPDVREVALGTAARSLALLRALQERGVSRG